VNSVQQVQLGSPVTIPKVMTETSSAVLNSSDQLQRRSILLSLPQGLCDDVAGVGKAKSTH